MHGRSCAARRRRGSRSGAPAIRCRRGACSNFRWRMRWRRTPCMKLDAEALARELAEFAPIVVTSRATTRSEYLQRPDLGRLLAAASQRVLTRGAYEISIVAADG